MAGPEAPIAPLPAGGAPRRRPQCKLHPSNESTGFCTACGAPFCPACKTNALGRALCLTCYESEQTQRRIHETEQKQFRQKIRQRALRARWYLIGHQGYLVRGFLWVKATGFLPAMRLAAFGVNLLVVLLLSGLLLVAGELTLAKDKTLAGSWGLYFKPWMPLLGALIYFVPAWGLFGTDLGKWPMGLQVRRSGGQRLGLWRGFWRFVGLSGMLCWMFFSVLAVGWSRWVITMMQENIDFWGVAFLWSGALVFGLFSWLMVLLMFLGRQKRHLADFLGQSVVVKKPEKPPADAETAPTSPPQA